jgi:hypothetical protein
MLKDLPYLNDEEIPRGGDIKRLANSREVVIDSDGLVIGNYDSWMQYIGADVVHCSMCDGTHGGVYCPLEDMADYSHEPWWAV